MAAPDLTPAQRARLERARDTSVAIEDLRRERRDFLREMQAQGWSMRELAELMGCRYHGQIQQWLR